MIVAFIVLTICFLSSGAMLSFAADPKAADPVTRELNSRLPLGLSDNDREENELATAAFCTLDCRQVGCLNCGICPDFGVNLDIKEEG